MLYQFSLLKQVITNNQRFIGLLSIFHVFENLYLPILLHSFSPVWFWFLEPFLSSSHFPIFFSISHPHFCKPYLQSKTFLNIRAVPSSAVFCSNVVFRTTHTTSIQFFRFFDVLQSTPTTTGMTLMLLMFHILLI